MLRDALKAIEAGQVTGVDDLAARLGLSSALVKQLVDDLVRLGYLEMPAGSSCSSGCHGCPIADRCGGFPQILVLTPRGRRAASQV